MLFSVLGIGLILAFFHANEKIIGFPHAVSYYQSDKKPAIGSATKFTKLTSSNYLVGSSGEVIVQ